MQLIAFGVHKHNVVAELWDRCDSDYSVFYDFVKSNVEDDPAAEFLFVNSSFSKEIIAVTDHHDELIEKFQAFFTNLLKLTSKAQSAFHILEGPDAVKHFFQLSLGIESFFPDLHHDFLIQAQKSLKLANDHRLAGAVINRLFQDALRLQGKIKQNMFSVDYSYIGQQIQALIRKIFGAAKQQKILAIGNNESFEKILSTLQTNNQHQFLGFSATPSSLNRSNFKIIPEQLLFDSMLQCQVIFRLNQDVSQYFSANNIRKLMQQRKNQPLLIINLDSTIKAESVVNRIYNLYTYSITDFQESASQQSVQADIRKLIDAELKIFFSWFYSKDLYRFGEIVGKSRAMEQILELIARISQTEITVLIQGESGTGKELIARAIHQNSPRRDKPFIVVNCSALPETLLESELFGHEKGAFTGASYSKKGLFEEADHGTIFLDEIGDTTSALQVKLLRVLQEGEIKRVGSNETLYTDVRLIAATNQKLAQLVKQNKFRQDLFYRLNVVNIDIPPLRERKEDILPLAQYFLGKYSDKMKKQLKGITADARQLLLKNYWPGNVRELENVIERAVALAIGNMVHSDDLPDTVRQLFVPGVVSENINRQMTLKDIEKEVIQATLLANGWDYDRVAQILDIGRTTLWRKMKEYGIQR
ncbi:MAG TPA: AAA family ATPase [bacterium]|nr:AAA family ATPase [bacterium]